MSRHLGPAGGAGNSGGRSVDYPAMTCSPFRESLSARLDGEPGDLPSRWVEDHLSTCVACQGWLQAAGEVTRRARVAPAERVPDLTMAVLQRLPAVMAARTGPRAWVDAALRLGLTALAAGQAALSFPPLVDGAGSMSAPAHIAHESGAWNVALAVAFAVVAVAPRLAAGALPLLGSFSAVLAVVTVRDLAAGHVHVDRAAGHLLLLAGTLVVAAMAWRQRPPRPGWSAPAWSLQRWAAGPAAWSGPVDGRGHRSAVDDRLRP